MATKVNVKFAVTLGVVLMVLFGLMSWAAYQKLTTSGEEYESKGDALLAQGAYQDASDMYRRAVGHDKTNIVWLTKWRDALLNVVPATQVEYLKYYRDYYLGILGTLAALQEQDPDPQRDYIDAWRRQLLVASSSSDSWKSLADHVATVLERLPADDPRTKSLHRYRGLATLARMEQVELRDSERQSSLDDLRIALEGNPDDVEVAVGIITWRYNEWLRVHRLRRTQTADQLWTAVTDEIQAQREHFGDAPELILRDVQAQIQHLQNVEENVGARITRLKAMAGADQPLLDALTAYDPSHLSITLLLQSFQTLKALRPASAAQTMLELLNPIASVRPDDPQLIMLRGEVFSDLARLEDAIAEFQRVVAMPDLPVSLEGLLLTTNLRANAIYREADATLLLYQRATDDIRRAELLARAKTLRAALIEQVTGAANSPIVMLLDGRLALVEGKSKEAVERLTALDAMLNGKDSQVIRLLGIALQQSNILGGAKAQYERLLELNPGDVYSMFELATLDYRLRNLETAADQLEQILTIAPDFTEARIRLSAIRAELGIPDAPSTATQSDPVRAAIISWQALMRRTPPESADALKILEEARKEHGDDARLLLSFILHHNQEGDAQNAMKVVNQALVLYPEDARFEDWRIRLQLQASDITTEEQLKIIDDTDSDPMQKAIAKSSILRSAGRDAEADAIFNEAASQAPDHPVVVEQRFMRALEAKDFAAARTAATTAARLNLDSVNGLLFQGRLEFAQNEDAKALATLRQVVDRLPFEPTALRLLGQTYLRLGRPNDALDALNRAFTGKPDSLLVARLYVQVLLQLQRYDEALAAVKNARRFNGADHTLAEQWLFLEETAGDRAMALSERLKRHESSPNDTANTVSLVRLLVADSNWDEAKPMIDALRAGDASNLEFARLEADWHARQGNIDSGAGVLRSTHVSERPIASTMALAQYFIGNNRESDAIDTLKEAIAGGSSPERIAELMLGDIYFRRGEYKESLPLLQMAATGNGPNDPNDIKRRLAEAQLRLERYEDAKNTLLNLQGPARQHPRTNILLARAATGLGDARAAQTYLDAAVAAAPDNPEPFIERASYNASNPTQLSDVLADLNQAIRLAPGAAQPRQLKAAILAQNGRGAEAIRELQEAVNRNPDTRELHLLLIEQLARQGQLDQALTAVDTAIKQFPTEAGWPLTAGDLLSRTGKWDLAEQRYSDSLRLEPAPQTAARLAQAQLQSTPPKLEAVIALTDQYLDSGEGRSTLLLLKSHALARLDRANDAKTTARQSFDAATAPGELRDWFSGVAGVFPDRNDLLAFLDTVTPAPSLVPIFTVLRARLLSQDPAMHDSVIASLRALDFSTAQLQTRLDAMRLLGGLYYLRNDYQSAAGIYQEGLALVPNELEFNNNLAYIRAIHLDDAQGALAPAEKAVQLAPTDSNALDTLGWVYFHIGRLSQARATLSQAVEKASTPAERLPALIHFSEALIAQSEFSQARRNAQSARDILDRSPALKTQYGEQLDALMKKINSTE